MPITYPGFITLENNTITIDSVNTTLNGGDHTVYDLTANVAQDGTSREFNLQPPAIQSTLQVFVDGMLQRLGADPEGDYIIVTPSLIRFNYNILAESTVHVAYSAGPQAGV